MALNTPTISELSDNIINDIETKTGQSVPLLAKAVFRVLSFAFAGIFIVLYKFGLWQFNQRFPQTAAEFYLKILGDIVRIFIASGDQFEGTVDVSVISIGSTLPAGTQLINNATGVLYLTQTTTVLLLATESIAIKSTTIGDDTTLSVSDVINFANPLSIVDNEAVLTAVTVLGTDDEPLEQYRQRVIDRYQKKPQGGALADYEQWSEEVDNVINAYPYSGDTAPDVKVFIEVDNQTDGIPTSPQITAVIQSINFDPITGIANRRPVTANVDVQPISRITFDVEVTGLAPDTAEIRDDIEAALENYFLELEPYITGLSVTRNDTMTVSAASTAAFNASTSSGSIFTSLVVKLATVVTPLYELGEGEKTKLGTLTFL